MKGYGFGARYYDGEYDRVQQDIDFYLDRLASERVRGAVLEPACGTGRVGLPIAAAGYQVCAFDHSQAMLRRARRRRSRVPAEVGLRLHLSCQDMTSFSYRRDFQAAILAFSSFNLLSGEEQRRSCLEAIARHLLPGGLLLADLVNPGEPGALRPPGPKRTRSTFRHPPYGHLVTKQVEETDDPGSGTTAVRYLYEERRDRDDTLVATFEVEFTLERIQRRDIERLLNGAGFDLEEIYGDCNRRPFTDRSPRMILQARRLAD